MQSSNKCVAQGLPSVREEGTTASKGKTVIPVLLCLMSQEFFFDCTVSNFAQQLHHLIIEPIVQVPQRN